MNRQRRPLQKSFVAGEIYDPSQPQQNYVAPAHQLEQQEQQLQQHHIVKIKEESVAETDNLKLGEGRLQYKKIFLTRKKSSVRAKEKKLRQNRQMRKVILPKNALMALNEVKGITISDFTIESSIEGGFAAHVTVNSNQYEGRGNSKIAAKNNACEKALRNYILEKMRQKPRSSKNQSELIDADMNETENIDLQKDATISDEIDEFPMVNLASFAIYKLFAEWEREGYNIPEMHPSQSQNGIISNDCIPKEPKKATMRNELPDRWEQIHPATLLCIMRPGLTYTDNGCNSDKPIPTQKVSVIVDNQEFVGLGRSKKIARRNAAVDVCNTLFGTNFIKEQAFEK